MEPTTAAHLGGLSLISSGMVTSTFDHGEKLRRFGLDCGDGIVFSAGAWAAGGEYTRQLVVRNVSTQTQSVRYQLPRNPTLVMAFPDPFVLAPGMSRSIEIVFRPYQYVDVDDTVDIMCGKGKFSVPVQARIARLEVTAPDRVDLGAVPVNEDSCTPFAIANVGHVDTSFSWDVAPPFSISPASGQLPAGVALQVVLSVLPTQAARIASTARLLLGSARGAVLNVQLSAHSQYAHIVLAGASNVASGDERTAAVIEASSGSAAAAAGTAMISTTMGRAKSTRAASLLGERDLQSAPAAAAAADIAAAAGGTPFVSRGDGVCSIVQFGDLPVGGGGCGSDSADGTPFVSLSGDGVCSIVQFGDLPVGGGGGGSDSADACVRTVVIVNDGPVRTSLSLEPIADDGGGDDDGQEMKPTRSLFTLSPSKAELQPGERLSVSIKCAPTTAGTVAAQRFIIRTPGGGIAVLLLASARFIGPCILLERMARVGQPPPRRPKTAQFSDAPAGTVQHLELLLTNVSKLPAAFDFDGVGAGSGSSSPPSSPSHKSSTGSSSSRQQQQQHRQSSGGGGADGGVFRLSAPRGVIPPLSSVELVLSFCPPAAGNYHRRLVATVTNGSPVWIDALGTAFTSASRPYPLRQAHVDAFRLRSAALQCAAHEDVRAAVAAAVGARNSSSDAALLSTSVLSSSSFALATATEAATTPAAGASAYKDVTAAQSRVVSDAARAREAEWALSSFRTPSGDRPRGANAVFMDLFSRTAAAAVGAAATATAAVVGPAPSSQFALKLLLSTSSGAGEGQHTPLPLLASLDASVVDFGAVPRVGRIGDTPPSRRSVTLYNHLDAKVTVQWALPPPIGNRTASATSRGGKNGDSSGEHNNRSPSPRRSGVPTSTNNHTMNTTSSSSGGGITPSLSLAAAASVSAAIDGRPDGGLLPIPPVDREWRIDPESAEVGPRGSAVFTITFAPRLHGVHSHAVVEVHVAHKVNRSFRLVTGPALTPPVCIPLRLMGHTFPPAAAARLTHALSTSFGGELRGGAPQDLRLPPAALGAPPVFYTWALRNNGLVPSAFSLVWEAKTAPAAAEKIITTTAPAARSSGSSEGVSSDAEAEGISAVEAFSVHPRAGVIAPGSFVNVSVAFAPPAALSPRSATRRLPLTACRTLLVITDGRGDGMACPAAGAAQTAHGGAGTTTAAAGDGVLPPERITVWATCDHPRLELRVGGGGATITTTGGRGPSTTTYPPPLSSSSTPLAAAVPPCLFIKPTCIGIASRRRCVLRNPSSVPLRFEWRVPRSHARTIRVTPASGDIEGGGEVALEVEFAPSTVGACDVHIPCYAYSLTASRTDPLLLVHAPPSAPYTAGAAAPPMSPSHRRSRGGGGGGDDAYGEGDVDFEDDSEGATTLLGEGIGVVPMIACAERSDVHAIESKLHAARRGSIAMTDLSALYHSASLTAAAETASDLNYAEITNAASHDSALAGVDAVAPTASMLSSRSNGAMPSNSLTTTTRASPAWLATHTDCARAVTTRSAATVQCVYLRVFTEGTTGALGFESPDVCLGTALCHGSVRRTLVLVNRSDCSLDFRLDAIVQLRSPVIDDTDVSNGGGGATSNEKGEEAAYGVAASSRRLRTLPMLASDPRLCTLDVCALVNPLEVSSVSARGQKHPEVVAAAAAPATASSAATPPLLSFSPARGSIAANSRLCVSVTFAPHTPAEYRFRVFYELLKRGNGAGAPVSFFAASREAAEAATARAESDTRDLDLVDADAEPRNSAPLWCDVRARGAFPSLVIDDARHVASREALMVVFPGRGCLLPAAEPSADAGAAGQQLQQRQQWQEAGVAMNSYAPSSSSASSSSVGLGNGSNGNNRVQLRERQTASRGSIRNQQQSQSQQQQMASRASSSCGTDNNDQQRWFKSSSAKSNSRSSPDPASSALLAAVSSGAGARRRRNSVVSINADPNAEQQQQQQQQQQTPAGILKAVKINNGGTANAPAALKKTLKLKEKQGMQQQVSRQQQEQRATHVRMHTTTSTVTGVATSSPPTASSSAASANPLSPLQAKLPNTRARRLSLSEFGISKILLQDSGLLPSPDVSPASHSQASVPSPSLGGLGAAAPAAAAADLPWLPPDLWVRSSAYTPSAVRWGTIEPFTERTQADGSQQCSWLFTPPQPRKQNTATSIASSDYGGSSSSAALVHDAAPSTRIVPTALLWSQLSLRSLNRALATRLSPSEEAFNHSTSVQRDLTLLGEGLPLRFSPAPFNSPPMVVMLSFRNCGATATSWEIVFPDTIREVEPEPWVDAEPLYRDALSSSSAVAAVAAAVAVNSPIMRNNAGSLTSSSIVVTTPTTKTTMARVTTRPGEQSFNVSDAEAAWASPSSESKAHTFTSTQSIARLPSPVPSIPAHELLSRGVFGVYPSAGRLLPGQAMTVRLHYAYAVPGAHALCALLRLRHGKAVRLNLSGMTLGSGEPCITCPEAIASPLLLQPRSSPPFATSASLSPLNRVHDGTAASKPPSLTAAAGAVEASHSRLLLNAPSAMPGVHLQQSPLLLQLAPVPLGCTLPSHPGTHPASDCAPVQTLTLSNHSDAHVAFVIDEAPFRSVAALAGYNCRVFDIPQLGSGGGGGAAHGETDSSAVVCVPTRASPRTTTTPGNDTRASETGGDGAEVFAGVAAWGRIAPGCSARVPILFTPLEATSYTLPLVVKYVTVPPDAWKQQQQQQQLRVSGGDDGVGAAVIEACCGSDSGGDEAAHTLCIDVCGQGYHHDSDSSGGDHALHALADTPIHIGVLAPPLPVDDAPHPARFEQTEDASDAAGATSSSSSSSARGGSTRSAAAQLQHASAPSSHALECAGSDDLEEAGQQCTALTALSAPRGTYYSPLERLAEAHAERTNTTAAAAAMAARLRNGCDDSDDGAAAAKRRGFSGPDAVNAAQAWRVLDGKLELLGRLTDNSHSQPGEDGVLCSQTDNELPQALEAIAGSRQTSTSMASTDSGSSRPAASSSALVESVVSSSPLSARAEGSLCGGGRSSAAANARRLWQVLRHRARAVLRPGDAPPAHHGAYPPRRSWVTLPHADLPEGFARFVGPGALSRFGDVPVGAASSRVLFLRNTRSSVPDGVDSGSVTFEWDATHPLVASGQISFQPSHGIIHAHRTVAIRVSLRAGELPLLLDANVACWVGVPSEDAAARSCAQMEGLMDAAAAAVVQRGVGGTSAGGGGGGGASPSSASNSSREHIPVHLKTTLSRTRKVEAMALARSGTTTATVANAEQQRVRMFLQQQTQSSYLPSRGDHTSLSSGASLRGAVDQVDGEEEDGTSTVATAGADRPSHARDTARLAPHGLATTEHRGTDHPAVGLIQQLSASSAPPGLAQGSVHLLLAPSSSSGSTNMSSSTSYRSTNNSPSRGENASTKKPSTSALIGGTTPASSPRGGHASAPPRPITNSKQRFVAVYSSVPVSGSSEAAVVVAAANGLYRSDDNEAVDGVDAAYSSSDGFDGGAAGGLERELSFTTSSRSLLPDSPEDARRHRIAARSRSGIAPPHGVVLRGASSSRAGVNFSTGGAEAVSHNDDSRCSPPDRSPSSIASSTAARARTATSSLASPPSTRAAARVDLPLPPSAPLFVRVTARVCGRAEFARTHGSAAFSAFYYPSLPVIVGSSGSKAAAAVVAMARQQAVVAATNNRRRRSSIGSTVSAAAEQRRSSLDSSAGSESSSSCTRPRAQRRRSSVVSIETPSSASQQQSHQQAAAAAAASEPLVREVLKALLADAVADPVVRSHCIADTATALAPDERGEQHASPTGHQGHLRHHHSAVESCEDAALSGVDFAHVLACHGDVLAARQLAIDTASATTAAWAGDDEHVGAAAASTAVAVGSSLVLRDALWRVLEDAVLEEVRTATTNSASAHEM